MPDMTSPAPSEKPTASEYSNLQAAYDWFNEQLFTDHPLPQVLLSLNRHRGARGYFAPRQYEDRAVAAERVHELSLNPDAFKTRSDEQILSTLVHEMVHVWQETYGKPSRRGYHNRQWAKEMKRVGLYPSASGQAGGDETGDRVTHYIVPGGRFEVAYRQLASTGFQLRWQARGFGGHGPPTRHCFTCPACRLRAWAKPSAMLLCGSCLVALRSESDERETLLSRKCCYTV